MDVGNDFYMVKFDLEEDRAKVIGEGPLSLPNNLDFDSRLRFIGGNHWSNYGVGKTFKVESIFLRREYFVNTSFSNRQAHENGYQYLGHAMWSLSKGLCGG